MMNYIDFNPQPTWSDNSNGVSLVYKLLSEKDQSWMTQSNSSICRWACPGGNGYFSALVAHLSEDDRKSLHDREQMVYKIGSAIAEFINKDYDVIFSRTAEKERTVTIDIPKVRKVGLFKKEEYVEHETRTEKYVEKETVAYKGWRIERLIRKENCGNGNPPEIMFFDYCLGADGRLYMIASEQNDSSDSIVAVRCICYSPDFLSSKYCNVYSAVISGVMGALDAIPMDENDPARNTHIRLDSDYYYNFPIQLDDGGSYPYAFLGGTINRLVNLLDDSNKEACCEKYEWMNTFLYPEEKNAVNESSRVDSSTQSAGVSTSRKSFDEYVLFSVNEMSRQPYAKQNDDFIANPTGCFLSAFFTERLVAADDLAKRYPQFQELADRIIKNHQQKLTAEMIEDERQLAMDLAGEHANDDKEIFIFLVAYEAILSQGTTDEKLIAVHNQMVKTLFGLDVVIGGWEEFMVAVALWFFDANNFQEEVKKKYIEIKDTPEYKEGGKKYRFDTFIKAGYKLVLDSLDDPGNAFLRHILFNRRTIAERVESQYSDFNRVIQAMDVTDNALKNSGDFGESFVNESNVICEFISDQNGILENQDYLILGAAIMAFMGRFEKPEENDGRLFIGKIEKIGEEIYTLPSIALYCAALWFADYKDYQQLLAEVINNPPSE